MFNKIAESNARYASEGERASAAHFELSGTVAAERLPWKVFAASRTAQPWPVEYLCSAISRGRWNPDAVRLCEREGIACDFTRRPVD